MGLIADTSCTLSGCAANIQKRTLSLVTVFGGARRTRELLRIDILGKIPKRTANFSFVRYVVLLPLVLRKWEMAGKFNINVPSA